jgi:hypothetical protein
MIRFGSASALALVLLAPSVASAQDERTVGLSMGYPASVAVLWHATERIALRPEITFSTVSSEFDDRDSSSAGFSVGASVLFYTFERDALSTYIAPAYQFARSTAESTTGLESTSRTHQFSGSFGVQYRLGERVRVFGETGVSFSAAKSEAEDIFNSASTSDRFGNRSAVGLVFYF